MGPAPRISAERHTTSPPVRHLVPAPIYQTLTKTFHGDLAGNSETDIITVHTEHPAAYVGMERFEGTLHGRKGGFVLQHNAGGANGVPWMTWKIVETTGTGDLAGIRGEGQIIMGPNG